MGKTQHTESMGFSGLMTDMGDINITPKSNKPAKRAPRYEQKSSMEKTPMDKLVICGEMSYSDFVHYMVAYRGDLHLKHIANKHMPDAYCTENGMYHGKLICYERDITKVAEVITECFNNHTMKDNILYDVPKVFDLIACSNSDKYSITGYVKDCIKIKPFHIPMA